MPVWHVDSRRVARLCENGGSASASVSTEDRLCPVGWRVARSLRGRDPPLHPHGSRAAARATRADRHRQRHERRRDQRGVPRRDDGRSADPGAADHGRVEGAAHRGADLAQGARPDARREDDARWRAAAARARQLPLWRAARYERARAVRDPRDPVARHRAQPARSPPARVQRLGDARRHRPHGRVPVERRAGAARVEPRSVRAPPRRAHRAASRARVGRDPDAVPGREDRRGVLHRRRPAPEHADVARDPARRGSPAPDLAAPRRQGAEDHPEGARRGVPEAAVPRGQGAQRAAARSHRVRPDAHAADQHDPRGGPRVVRRSLRGDDEPRARAPARRAAAPDPGRAHPAVGGYRRDGGGLRRLGADEGHGSARAPADPPARGG